MKQRSALTWLVPAIAGLTLITAGVGLFWQAGAPFPFTTLRGETVQMYGQGLYRYDSYFKAPILRGTDAVVLGAGLPLLLLAFRLYRRGSLRGGLVLTGALSFFLYYGASLAFSVAFNRLFPVYVALLSVSFFAFISALTALDAASLAARLSARLPRRGLAAFLIVAGLGVFSIWASELIGPVLDGRTPANLGADTSLFTHAFDIAIIAPVVVLTGLAVLRREPLGYLLAAPLLVLCTLIGLVVIAQTVAQTLAGITFPIGVYIGMIGSWIILGACAIGLAIAYFRSLTEPASDPASLAAAQA